MNDNAKAKSKWMRESTKAKEKQDIRTRLADRCLGRDLLGR